MAAVNSMRGTKLLVQMGDGASPETFAQDCLINGARGISFQADTNEDIVPDCDNPDDPAWKEVTKDGLSATVSGAGILHTDSVEDWWTWFNSDDARNARVNINVGAAAGGGYWAGAFKLTAMEVTGERNAKSTVSVTLMSTGALTWTAAS
jgi:predicted secreted protein